METFCGRTRSGGPGQGRTHPLVARLDPLPGAQLDRLALAQLAPGGLADAVDAEQVVAGDGGQGALQHLETVPGNDDGLGHEGSPRWKTMKGARPAPNRGRERRPLAIEGGSSIAIR